MDVLIWLGIAYLVFGAIYTLVVEKPTDQSATNFFATLVTWPVKLWNRLSNG
jgi:hypothetical protein